MLIGDISVDVPNAVLTLLVRLSDKLTPNSVYSDPAAGHFNEHIKAGNVGADFGCHVLISLRAECDLPNVYTCAIEKITGMAADLVRRILSKFMSYEFNEVQNSFSYPHPAGGLNRAGLPRTERCCPHIELRAGHPTRS